MDLDDAFDSGQSCRKTLQHNLPEQITKPSLGTACITLLGQYSGTFLTASTLHDPFLLTLIFLFLLPVR